MDKASNVLSTQMRLLESWAGVTTRESSMASGYLLCRSTCLLKTESGDPDEVLRCSGRRRSMGGSLIPPLLLLLGNLYNCHQVRSSHSLYGSV